MQNFLPRGDAAFSAAFLIFGRGGAVGTNVAMA
jgi:hypothetical protein